MAFAGGLDPTFGGGSGTSLIPVMSVARAYKGLDDLNLVQVEADGSIIAAGPAGLAGGGTTYGLIRVNADGTRDTSFGEAGEADVALPAGLLSNGGASLLLQGDGKILLVTNWNTSDSPSQGETVLARFNANGSPDSNFGTAGVAVINLTPFGVLDGYLTSVAVQADGKIVLAGSSRLPANPSSVFEVTVARLKVDGTLDPSFAGTGQTTFSDIPTANLTQSPLPPNESAGSVVVQANGQLVLVGTIVDRRAIANPVNVPELIRLNADGIRDSSISQSGLLASGIVGADGLLLQPDGKFLVVGVGQGGTKILARLNADGSLEKSASFLNDSTSGLTLQPDGKIVQFGSSNSGFTASRINANLTPDASFGFGGHSSVFIPLPPPAPGVVQGVEQANAGAVGPDGRIVLVGSNPAYTRFSTLPATYLAVARLTATGTSAHRGDFTGDGIADPAIYLPAFGAFAIGDSSGKTTGRIELFGPPGPGGTIPAPGDYDGASRQEIGGYLPAQGIYAYRPAGGGPDVGFQFGTPGAGQSIPAPADYYGTGVDDIAVYLAASGSFAIKDPTGKTAGAIIPFGMPGVGHSIPVPGDYDGSGHVELAVYVPSVGAFFYRPANGGPDVMVPFGTPGAGNSLPVPGDYTGVGHDEFAVYLPALGAYAYRVPGQGDVIIPFGTPGAGQSLPAPADYTGSGHVELGVYLPSLGLLAYRPPAGADVYDAFGFPGAGQTIPVTRTILSPFPGSGGGTAHAMAIPGVAGGFAPLDFITIATPARKVKAGPSAQVLPMGSAV